MEKPIVFISHSSKDEKYLRHLKQLLDVKTGESIKIFLSSDGQSIPFGRNWVHKIEEALSDTSLMFVFITPNSLRSNWIYFEAGHAYSRGIKVIPIGLGIDLNNINPPLSLLQGFNLDKSDALGNIVATINETYKTNFNTVFTQQDFDTLFSKDVIQFVLNSVRLITVSLRCEPDFQPLDVILSELASNQIEYITAEKRIWSSGLRLQIADSNNITISFDGLLAGIYIPVIEKLCSNNKFTLAKTGRVFFERNHTLVTEDFIRQTALLAGTDIKPELSGQMKYKEISFRLLDIGNRDDDSRTRMDILFAGQLVTFDWLRDICQILLEKQIIIIDPSPRIPII
jgi:TIR domain